MRKPTSAASRPDVLLLLATALMTSFWCCCCSTLSLTDAQNGKAVNLLQKKESFNITTSPIVKTIITGKAVPIPSAVAVELDELLPETAENGTITRMTVLLGETVLLPCKAYSLGQRTVSWIRRRDWHIMSSGSHIYTADGRFSILNRPGSPDWILMLKSPQLHDSGLYECQISGGQGQVSHFIELLVWAPVASIAEGGEHHVDAESNIQLHCQLRPEASNSSNSNNDTPSTDHQQQFNLPMVVGGGAPFVWFHNGKPLMDGGKSSAGSGSVRIYLEGDVGDWTALISRLLVERADPADSGNYTCAPWRGKAASVSVFISQGDRPAAVQRQAALRSSISPALIFGLNFILLSGWCGFIRIR